MSFDRNNRNEEILFPNGQIICHLALYRKSLSFRFQLSLKLNCFHA